MAHSFHRDDATFSQVTFSDITGVLAVANGGTGDSGTAWTSYNPTVTATAGTFSSVAATGVYKLLGKTAFVKFIVTCTSVGTASTAVIVTLPAVAVGNSYILSGRETVLTGKMIQGFTTASSSNLTAINYDNTFPLASGGAIAVTGVYETT